MSHSIEEKTRKKERKKHHTLEVKTRKSMDCSTGTVSNPELFHEEKLDEN